MAKKSTNNKPWASRLREWEEAASAPLPPSGDWDRLAKKMMPQEQRKKRLPIWFWWLGLVAAGLLLAYWWPVREPSNTAAPTLPVALDSNKATQPPAASVKDTKEATIAKEKLAEKNSQQAAKRAGSAQHTAVAREPSLTTFKQAQPTIAASQPRVAPSIAPSLATTQTAQAEARHAVPPLPSLPIRLLPEKHELMAPAPWVSNTAMGPRLNQKKNEKWALGPSFQLAQNSLNNSSSTGLRPISSEQQQGLFSGLALRRTIGSRWGVQLGISSGQETASSRYRFQRIYTASNERTTTEGEIVNNFSVELDGKYAKTDTDIEVSRPANQPIGTQTRLVIETQLKERVRTTQVPLLLTYDLPLSSQLSLRLGSGVSWQRQEIETAQQSRLAQAGRFQIHRARTLNRTALVDESLWLGQFSLGLAYQLGSRWSLTGQTNGFTQIGKASSEGNYQGIGGQLLLLYHF